MGRRATWRDGHGLDGYGDVVVAAWTGVWGIDRVWSRRYLRHLSRSSRRQVPPSNQSPRPRLRQRLGTFLARTRFQKLESTIKLSNNCSHSGHPFSPQLFGPSITCNHRRCPRRALRRRPVKRRRGLSLAAASDDQRQRRRRRRGMQWGSLSSSLFSTQA